jgi:hypothetical protein
MRPTQEKQQQERSVPAVPAPSTDGYDEIDPSDRRIRGAMVKFDANGKAWKRSDGSPLADRYLATALDHGLQHWKNGQVIDEHFERPLPSLDELNQKVPRSQWEKGMNGGPRPPWTGAFFVYLVDPQTAEIVTFVSSSIGGGIAYGDLKGAVALMRKLRASPVVPLVTLGTRTMKTKFGPRPRPHFEIVGWHGHEPAPQLEEAAPAKQPKKIARRKEHEDDDLDDDVGDI